MGQRILADMLGAGHDIWHQRNQAIGYLKNGLYLWCCPLIARKEKRRTAAPRHTPQSSRDQVAQNMQRTMGPYGLGIIATHDNHNIGTLLEPKMAELLGVGIDC